MANRIPGANISDPTAPSTLSDADVKGMKAAVRRNYKTNLEGRQYLRQKLRGEHYIERVHEAADTLFEDHKELTTGQVGALKASIDANLRLLDRILPPLKAIEVHNDPENPHNPVMMTTGDLLRLANLHVEPDLKDIPGEIVESVQSVGRHSPQTTADDEKARRIDLAASEAQDRAESQAREAEIRESGRVRMGVDVVTGLPMYRDPPWE